jgi:carboxymethylenebutenolidase
LPADQITADLNAVAAYVSKLPACNGKVIVTGYCWGGGQSFRYAANNKDLKAALVFYGTGPTDEAVIKKINCPVYGFYGGNDARVTSTVDKSKELMAWGDFEPVTTKGGPFMRAGEQPGATANKKARSEHDAHQGHPEKI